MNHVEFIVAAYSVTAIVMAGLLVWLVADGRAVTRRLKELDARGIRRRSARAAKVQPG
jgi:heme exporter protein D